MSEKGQSNGEVPGWVILSPDAVPHSWRSRAVPMMLVPLGVSEAGQLLAEVPVEQGIADADLPLIHLVAKGHTAAEIARALDLSTRTVYRHITRLRTELGVATMEELATELARRGF
jgi:DNA-binding CsgD family transcriptional regulator